MKIAYLTTIYPKTSHSFIRREIRELERRGHEIVRMAVREPQETLPDPRDAEEGTRTYYCLARGVLRLVMDFAVEALRQPVRMARAARQAAAMSRRSDSGALRHLAYLVEAASLRARFRTRPVDHLHVHFGTNPAAVALLLRRLGGPPFSITLHGPDEWDAPVGLSLADKIREAGFVVAISSHCAAQARRWSDLRDWKKILVVRSGAPYAALERGDAVGEGARALLFVGRLTAQKEPLLLIDAMAELVRRGADAKLWMIGDGELRREIEARIRRRGLSAHVELMGWCAEDEVLTRMHNASCIVLPSSAEGLPVVLVEALAMQRPVVSTYTAGIPELVEPGVSGWLVPSGDLGALVAALWQNLRTSPADLSAMGRAGRARVEKDHDLATEVGRLEEALLARSACRSDFGSAGVRPSTSSLWGRSSRRISRRSSGMQSSG